ncbi:MAG TPA: sodium:solute symporter family protein [Candidatus Acidoferrales bacterium]|nr:sodium:solute symporter family protein [Candidatus Acidoferrales bacterium]
MSSLSSHFLVVLVIYFLCILTIGVLGLRKTQTEEDFLTASRTIGPWVGGAVLAATQISAGTLVGTVGRHYATGVSWVWIWPGVWCGWLISAVFVGPKLREFGAITIPDFLAARFQSETARGLSALFIVGGYMILLVAQYQACGVILQALFGIRPIAAMLLLVASTLVYTILGGVRSSSYIDFLQILIVASGMLLAAPVLAHHFGGIRLAGQYLGSLDARLTGWWYNGKQLFGYAMAFGFSLAAAPYEMTRFYSMRDKATVRYAIGVSFLFQAVIGGCALLIGLLTRALFPQLPSADQASSIMAFNVLPPLAGSLFIVALISAIMSNVNAVLLVASAGLSHDLYSKIIDPRASDRRRLLLNRLCIVLLSLVPIWFALRRYGDVQSIVVVESRFLASFFFVPVVVGLNSLRGKGAAAVSSMAAGFAGCLFWSVWSGARTTNIDPVEVGIAASAALYFLVSALERSRGGNEPPVPARVES